VEHGHLLKLIKINKSERKILRRIFGPKRNENGVCEIRTNRDLNNLFDKPNIVGILKSKRIN